MDVPGSLREKDRGLAGRIGATDDDDLFAATELPLERRRAVIDTRAFELGEVRKR